MAVGGFDTLVTGNEIKTAYPSKRIKALINQATPFRRSLASDLPAGAKWGDGGVLTFNAVEATPQNVGSGADASAMAVPKDRVSFQYTLKPCLFTSDFQLGFVAARAAQSDKAAFNGGETRRRTEETIGDLAKYIESSYVGTHGTQRRCTIASDGSNTFVAELPEGVLLLKKNNMISVRTTDGGDSARDSCDYRKITKIVVSTRTVTYDGADQTLVAGDHVHIVPAASQTSLTTISPNGLRGLIDDGTYLTTVQGVSRDTYEGAKAQVASNGNTLRNVSETIITEACHKVRHATGATINKGWINTGQATMIQKFKHADWRVVTSGPIPTKLETGYTEQSLWHNAPGANFQWNISTDVIPREMYLLDMTTFFHYKVQEVDWWEGEGGQKMYPIPSTGTFLTAWFAGLVGIENLGCDAPPSNCVIRDLRDPLIDALVD